MGHLALCILALATGYIKAASIPKCCKEKTVGDVAYKLVEETDTIMYGCKSNCVFEKKDSPGSKFCFKEGDLEVVCDGDGPSGSLIVRKNLTTLNHTEIHHLIHALIAAKKSGSYTGPKISGPMKKNSDDFNSSFNAVASFHGYPGLCPLEDVPSNPGDCCWHSDPRFLPWHRLIIMQFNYALQFDETYKHVVIPYWDWTQDFEQLPHLVRNPTIIDPITKEKLKNPFYRSWMPGLGKFTERSPEVLINFNKGCNDSNIDCTKAQQNYQGRSRLLNMTLLALEETTYIHFEGQIEQPHNQVHNQLGFTPSTCLKEGDCYPYTMQDNTYASFDPIFMIFHTMVDYQWAVFQALQEHRGLLYENDCHPYFEKDLLPYSTNFNANNATKSHSRGTETVNYKKEFGYEYDDLKLNNMTIPKLNSYLEGQNNIDRLFAGFSLPDMHIASITFNACHPITNCVYSSPHFHVSTVHTNKKPAPGIYKNSNLMIFEVTHQLPQFGLTASQNIGFKITSTSHSAKNWTFTPVGIFRKGGTQVNIITVHWREEAGEYNYAPFFKVRPKYTNKMRFLLDDGSMSVYQYKDEEEFNDCSTNRSLVQQEIELSGTKKYYFQNPIRTGCKKENKLIVDMTQPCIVSGNEAAVNFSITWTFNIYEKYKKGICMTPGTSLELNYDTKYHNVEQLPTETDFDNCTLTPQNGVQGPLTFPSSENGFEEQSSPYYIVCPVAEHCNQGMKVKICVKKKCPKSKTCD